MINRSLDLVAKRPPLRGQRTASAGIAGGYDVPDDHWFHVHNYFVTYRWRVRGTKNICVTVVNKGRINSLDSPEVRALTSRYSDPKDLLTEDWVPEIPGVNAKGR